MKTPPVTQNSDYENPPAGVYSARCYKIVDLGTQQEDFQGNAITRRKIVVSWELHKDGVRMSDGRPFAISKTYTLSLSEKANLRHDLEAWRGTPFKEEELQEGFDIEKLLGKKCTLQLTEKVSKSGNKYMIVNSIMQSDGDVPNLENPKFIFDLENFDQENFDKLSDYYKQQIMESPEYMELTPRTPEEVKQDEIGDIPF